jgi:hypothetical protein
LKVRSCASSAPERQFDDVFGFRPRPHTVPDALHQIALHQRTGDLLVTETLWQQFLLGSVRERHVAHILAAAMRRTERQYSRLRRLVGTTSRMTSDGFSSRITTS